MKGVKCFHSGVYLPLMEVSCMRQDGTQIKVSFFSVPLYLKKTEIKQKK